VDADVVDDQVTSPRCRLVNTRRRSPLNVQISGRFYIRTQRPSQLFKYNVHCSVWHGETIVEASDWRSRKQAPTPADTTKQL